MKDTKIGKLIIVRHHESEWNKLGLWTGLRDKHLTEYGFKKSEEMASLIKDIRIDCAFASVLVRAIETLASMLETAGKYFVPKEYNAAINERDYGDYTGKNKWEVEKLVGKEEFDKIRRGWNCPVPKGETLKMVYERTVPFFLKKILPVLKDGKNVIVAAHGNSLRALMKYIENISDEEISNVEMPFGAVIIYDLDSDGHKIKKEVRTVESKVNA